MLPFPIISNLNVNPSINVISDVQAHNNSLFVLTNTGHLYCTGSNGEGQLGLGDQTNRNNWNLSDSSVNTFWLGSSNVSLIKRVNGTYLRAGRSYAFNGASTVATTWTDVSSMFSAAETAASSTISQICVTNENVVLRMANGTVYGTGRNLYGALGNGGTTNYTTFTSLGLSGITKIATCDQNIFALNSTTGVVYGCGANSSSQLNTTASSTITTFRTVTTGATNI